MKRKDIIFPAVALLGGALGFVLRQWQLAEALIPEYQLFYVGHPATTILFLLFAACALFFLIFVREARGSGTDYLSVFRAPSPVYMGLMTAAALLFLGAGLLGVQKGLNDFLLFRAYTGVYAPSQFISVLLTAALALLSVPALLVLGKMSYRGTANRQASRLVVFPAACALVWLFSVHLDNGTNPVLLDYGFSMLGAACFTLGQYYVAGYFHDRPCLRRAMFFSLMSVVLGLVVISSPDNGFELALAAAFTLTALANSWALLRNAFGPAWPEPAAPEAGDDDDEL